MHGSANSFVTRRAIRQATNNCTGQCRIIERGVQQGAYTWLPTYDRDGNLLNTPPENIQRKFSCLQCGKSMTSNG